MAPSTTNGGVPENTETREVRIKLMKPGDWEPTNISIEANLSTTTRDLKRQIQEAAPEHPHPDSQRLIYQGRQLSDDTVLREAFRNDLDSARPLNLHAVVRPDPSSTASTSVPARSTVASQNRSSGSSGSSSSSTTSRTTFRVPVSSSAFSSNAQDRVSSSSIPRTLPGGLTAGLPADAQLISYNREVRITTTGQFVRSTPPPRAQNAPQGGAAESSGTPVTAADLAIGDREMAPGTQDTPQASRNSQINTHSANIPRSNSNPTNPIATPSVNHSHASAIRTNSGSQRIIHTQTHTIRFSGRPGASGTSSGQGNQNAYSTAHDFGLSGGMVPPVTPLRHSSLFSDTTLPLTPTPPQQYYLLQGPDGPNSILLSPTPPAPSFTSAAFPPPRIRSPLAPIGSHMAPPPGLNLNDVLGPELNATGDGASQRNDFGQREAALHAQIEALRQENNRRLARLEQARQLLYQRFQAPVPPQNAGGNQGIRVQGFLRPPGRRNAVIFGPFDYLANLFLWLFGGNAQVPNEEILERALHWLVENTWLAIRLAIGVYLLGGGRDYRRDAVLWVAAVIIFIIQSGIFTARLRPLIHRVNEWIPDVNRPAGPPQAAQGNPPAGQPGIHNPQELAQRLIQEHNNRQGGFWDNIQTSVSIFLASLVPGLGERVGNARAAEEERRRQALEQAAQAAGGENAAPPPVPAEAVPENQPPQQVQDQQPPQPPPQGEDVQAMFGF